MSSVTRFLRQPVVGTRTAAVPTLSGVTGVLYQFIPATGNYVGNYPPGWMSDITSTVNTALGGYPTGSAVMRDMGKTVKAVIGVAGSQPTDLITNSGFFRQYQILVPSVISSATSASNFGVIGDANTPTAYSDFYTVYVPIVVGGTIAGVSNGSGGVAPTLEGASLITDGML
jgi:hypothetical protein